MSPKILSSLIMITTFLKSVKFLVGLPGIEPGSHPPQGCILPLYYSPLGIYFSLPIFLMQRAQAKTRLPFARRVYWRFGYFLFFGVGLYLPRSFFLAPRTIEPLPQIAHVLISKKVYIKLSKKVKIKWIQFHQNFFCTSS